MRYLAALSALALLVFAAPAAHASTTSGVFGVYAPEWNMVGGPTGTDFTAAAEMDAWVNGNYVTSPGHVINACEGYWARFVGPVNIPLPTATGPTQSCPLQAGWTLVGNPFSGLATIPSGVVAYHWNPDRSAYDVVTSIPPGASVWIQSASAGSVTLTYAPASQTHVPVQYVSGYPTNPGPYTLHVGDTLELLILMSTPTNLTADPHYLALEDAGETGDMSCTSTCVINLLVDFWTYRAINPGTTQIAVTPRCLGAPTCNGLSGLITVNILP